MNYIQKEDVILINKMTVDRHGGKHVPPANFLKESALDYLLEAVQSEMFGEPLYPEIYDKAGLYMFNVNSNHIFQDGNKRTGLGSALLFLRLTGFELSNILVSVDDKDKQVPTTKNLEEARKDLKIDDEFQLLSNTSASRPSAEERTIHNNLLLTAFTLDVASSSVTLEECQKWFKENVVSVK